MDDRLLFEEGNLHRDNYVKKHDEPKSSWTPLLNLENIEYKTKGREFFSSKCIAVNDLARRKLAFILKTQ